MSAIINPIMLPKINETNNSRRVIYILLNKLLFLYNSTKVINIFDGLENIKLLIILNLLSNSHNIIKDNPIIIWVILIFLFSFFIFFNTSFIYLSPSIKYRNSNRIFHRFYFLKEYLYLINLFHECFLLCLVFLS